MPDPDAPRLIIPKIAAPTAAVTRRAPVIEVIAERLTDDCTLFQPLWQQPRRPPHWLRALLSPRPDRSPRLPK